MPNTTLEQLLAELNKTIFLREFSFPHTEFTSQFPGETKEFADHVVWIDDLVLLFQVKERDLSASGSPETERKWFVKSVMDKATRQIRDTLGFLRKHSAIEIKNLRGDSFGLSAGPKQRILKLVMYQPSASLPTECANTRHHVSRTAGFIHIIPWDDYRGVCRNLSTPEEIWEYFGFREQILGASQRSAGVSEVALVGQFLSGEFSAEPSEHYRKLVGALTRQDFDLTGILDGIRERIEDGSDSGSGGDYYGILIEFAKLNRLELREIKTRFKLAIGAVEEDELRRPMRIVSPASGCGFVIIPVTTEFFHHRRDALINFTEMAKYDQKLERVVGVSVAKEGKEFLIDWCLMHSEWKPDRAIEELITKTDPFPPVKAEVQARYPFGAS